MKVLFEQEALEEYRDAALFSEERFGLGREFVEAVRLAVASITMDPVRFQIIRSGIRIFRMRRFPFHLLYQYSEELETLTIYAVAHHARRPDYWRTRVKPPESP
jgi:mRNA-degrading endonuclease RelE of RelBE toxin-antitoxin system